MASLRVLFLFMAMSLHAMAVRAIDGNWYDARATFYGDMGGGETMRKCITIIFI